MERFYVATEQFYVMTLLVRRGKFSVVTENFKSRQSWLGQGEIMSR